MPPEQHENHMHTQQIETSELDAATRYQTCIHEAAHAVIHAMGGDSVYCLAVAPEGATEWTTVNPEGKVLSDLLGVCCTSSAPFDGFLRWDSIEGTLVGLKRAYSDYLKQLKQWHGVSAAKEHRRRHRAYVCGMLAGPIAEAISEGCAPGEIFLEPDEYVPTNDLVIAEAACWLLPFKNEFEHLAAVTESALRAPDTWRRVTLLAEMLESTGRLQDELIGHFPLPLRQWPPSPRSRYRPA